MRIWDTGGLARALFHTQLLLFCMGSWIVPVPEIDSSMECTVLNPGECLVKYFEDNKYSVVPFTDLQHFKPTTIPYIEFELAAGQKFLKNSGVVNALSYIESGKVKRRFSWNRWGSAQDQDLNLDMQRNKAITLPLISDEEFLGTQPQSHQAGVASQSSSAASSPVISTKDDTDIESGSNNTSAQPGSLISTPLTPSASASSSLPSTSSATGKALKNGMQRSGAASGISSHQQQSSTLLPSPVSLHDLTTAEPTDETELDTRSTRTKTEGTATKDSPAIARSRSRRGSREVDNKTTSGSAATAMTTPISPKDGTTNKTTEKKDASKRSRSTSDQTTSNSVLATTTPQATTTDSTAVASASGTGEVTKKRKTGAEPIISTDPQTITSEPGTVPARYSRQESVELTTSPRSTRHSSRHSKAPEHSGEQRPESPVELTRLSTHRMTRQRSMPKSANSLPPSSTATAAAATSSEAKHDADTIDVKQSETPNTRDAVITEDMEDVQPTTISTKTEIETTAMDVDEPESKSSRNQGRGREKSTSIPPSSLVSTTASSSTSSPASMGPDDEKTSPSGSSSSSSLSSTNGRVQSLVLERQEMDRGFEVILPTLPIGSKEREAFYENIMDHMQKLRQEHRRLKEVLKSSEYVPKGRRATRSSPQYHSHHYHRHHHHRYSPGAEKQNHRNESPVHSKNSHSSTANSGYNGGSSNKENNHSSQTTKGSSVSSSAAATKAETTGSSPVYTGSTPSSAILTSNISTTTRRSAATAAAAAVTATVSRTSRQNNGSNGSSADKEPKRRGGAAAAAAAADMAAATGDNGTITTRAKRRLR
ncbi:hypothetical protein FBU30_007103 [Linnemannia zychae]|nr:hypothetical protein FBU30_007103 [Linnemannia zychae]